MGKCDKQLAAKLVAELLASLFVQFLGCSAPDATLVSYANTPFSQKHKFWVEGKDKDRRDLETELSVGFASMAGSAQKPNTPVGISTGPSLSGFSHDGITYAFCWGGGVMAMTQAFRVVSGAHINPCVSIASMILKNVKVLDGCLYIIMQLIGSCVGFLLAYVTYLPLITDYAFCCTRVFTDPWWYSIFVEFFLTGVWIFAMCASWHKSNEEMQDSMSARIGLVVIGITLIGSQYTLTCMNPFRSLWPAIVFGFYEYIWVYIAIPIVTAILLAFMWRYLILQAKDETVTAEDGGGGGGDKE